MVKFDKDGRRKFSLSDLTEGELAQPDFIRFASSRPQDQFFQQMHLLERRILRYFEWDDTSFMMVRKKNWDRTALESPEITLTLSDRDNVAQNVKARWIQDGIRDPDWEKTGEFDKWPHEKTDRIFEFDPNASRPSRQFELQIAAELEWLECAGTNADLFDPVWDKRLGITDKDPSLDDFPELYGQRPEWNGPRPDDWGVIARYNVKSRWIRDHIWDPSWGDTPGNKWQHEKYDPASFGRWRGDPRLPDNLRTTHPVRSKELSDSDKEWDLVSSP